MSKLVKNLITDSYRKRFEGVDGGVVIDIRGIESNTNNNLRNRLSEDGIKVTVVKNTLAKRAFAETMLANIGEVLDGPNAICYSAADNEDVSVVSVARKLIDIAKDLKLEFKGALMDGLVFGANEIEALSKYPTREEAQAQVVQVILGPAAAIAGCLTGPANSIAGILSTIEEKLEKGETIAKVG